MARLTQIEAAHNFMLEVILARVLLGLLCVTIGLGAPAWRCCAGHRDMPRGRGVLWPA